jgi:peptidyl-tRNA hydrolase
VANYQQDLNNDLYEDPEWEGTVDQTRMEEQIGYLNDAVRYMEDAGSAIYDALGA